MLIRKLASRFPQVPHPNVEKHHVRMGYRPSMQPG